MKSGIVPWVLLVASGGACGGSEPARDLQIETTFTIAPGEERHECHRINVDADVFMTKIATTAAPGVHHQILAVTDQTEPEGVTPCGLALDVSESWIFVAGNAAEELAMPANVAYPIAAGGQLMLQLHLFNPGDTPINSSLTVELTGIAEADVVSRAQLVAAGSLQLSLPPGVASTETAACTLDKDVSVFGLLPHMHYLGTTFKAWVANGPETTMLYDDDFLLESQPFESFAPVAMPRGASLNVECNYFNTTTETVGYGLSALEEMCFAMTYYYPAIEGQGAICLN